MNSKNKIIIDNISLEIQNIIEEAERNKKYGTYTITAKGLMLEGIATKDYSVEIAFKKTIKL